MGSVVFPKIEEVVYFTGNSLSDFINTLRNYPKATDKSNTELLHRYHQGDMEARELLIKTNLRLVVSQAKRYTTHSYELLDVINEGIIGLMQAIEAYEEGGTAKFSTYSVTCIRNSIINALSKNDSQIRRPRSVAAAVSSYNRIVKVCMEEGKELPTDDEYRELLNVSEEQLKLVKTDYLLNTSSLNETVGDSEETEIADFVPYDERGYDGILDNMTNKQFLLHIKNLFSDHPFYYYVLYNRIFDSAPEKQREIGNRFFITNQQVSNIERMCLEQLKNVIETSGSIYNIDLPEELERNIDDTNVEPINPDWLVQYLFFRDSLQEEERKIFKLLITSIYLPNDVRFSKMLGMSLATYRKFHSSLMEKISFKDDKTKTLYAEFKKSVMKKYGTSIFSIDLDADLKPLDMEADSIARVWDSFSYPEIMDVIAQNNISVTPSMKDLLERYFDGGREKFVMNTVFKRRAERELNAILFGFHKKNEIKITGLYDSLTNNRHRFTLNQYDYLMSRKFHQDNLRERGIIRVSELGDLRELSRRLEKIHYGISRYRELNFTKAKYESVREKCLKTISSDQIAILDMFYGIGFPKYSIQQIAEKRKVSYEDARVALQEAKRVALRTYLGRNKKRALDAEIYIPYVLDESIDLSDETRTMLTEFLIEKKTYEEIESLHGIDKKKKNQQRRVATVIGQGLLKIDCYRFGIFNANSNYTTDECREFFATLSLTDEERNVIQMKMDGYTKEAIMAETELSFIRVSYILDKFYKLCDEHKVASVKIDESDIRREVTAHISEMVLNEKERLILAKLYGVTCDVNPTGIRFTEEEFRLAHPNMSKQYNRFLKNALNTVRSKKAGFTRASLAYMSRDDLKLSLKDPRIPISQKERELLYYSFELNGYPYKTLKELSEIYGELPASLKMRIERTFVTIYKYENDEISSTISYEDDVEPYLKYFSKSDQEILRDLYANKLTYEEIGQNHGLSKGQVENLVISLDSSLKDLIEEEITGYDFDYFWSVIDKPKIPFYGDKEKAKQIFSLYYEKRMSADDIISYLGLTCKRTVVLRAMSDLMIAVSKYREGIKKVKCPKPGEIRAYYKRNSGEMDFEHKEMYQQYFERVEQEMKSTSFNAFSQPNIPAGIILDLIEEGKDNAFSFEKTSREEALAFIKKHKEISNSTLYTILRAYHINQRELMSGREQMKVLRFLSELKVSYKVLALRKSA